MSINPFAHALRQRLPAMEKLLLLLLGDRADPWGGSIYFALDTLVDEAGMSRSTLQRTFRELIKRNQVELQVPATPTTTAFYRMVGVPDPIKADPSDDGCPHVLRRAVLYYFDLRCSWCQSEGTKEFGGDGKPWAVTRIDPTKYGGRFTPDNVTRACAFCARKKKRDVTTAVLALTEVVSVKGCQLDTPQNPAERSQSDTSGVSTGHLGGVSLIPDPSPDPISDPIKKEQGRAPRPAPAAPQDPAQNIRVITKIAHEVIDQLGPTHDDLAEAVKSLCATRGISYNSAVVHAALESARWQRTHPAEVH